MTEAATPEEQAKAHNIVKALQEKMAATDAKAGSAAARNERAERTMDPDAKKTRDLIRQGGYISLPVLAKDLIPRISDLAERHALEEKLAGFIAANQEYRRVEELPMALIDWIGGPNGRVDLPEGNVPDHKRDLVLAWHALVHQVNHLSKVGIVKPQRLLMNDPTAITLLADPDGAPTTKVTTWE